MADELKRWLLLQQDLGGDEVILDAPIDIASALTRPVKPGQGSVPGPPVPATGADPGSVPVRRAAAAPRSRPAEPAAGEPVDWRKGAPEIPGPGLVVSSRSAGAEAWRTLDEIAAAARTCTRCPLSRTRTHAVPGEGDPAARLFVVGEGPGESEDLSGRPFVGRAGELLDKMLASIGIARGSTFIANVVKCRPPKNRVPLPDEREACMPFLRRQIELVDPAVLLALGGTAAETLLGVKTSLGQLRSKVHQWNGIPLIVTYHPAALLRNPNWKRPAWDDVRIARQLLDRGA